MNTVETIQKQCQLLRLGAVAYQVEALADQAAGEGISYLQFAQRLLESEIDQRRERDLERRKKAAHLPARHRLEQFDTTGQENLPPARLQQLKELSWLDQQFNIILMGPPGTGKTLLAAGLCHQAIGQGYRAYFRTMQELVDILKARELSARAKTDYRRLCKAQLIVIDDLMMTPQSSTEANLFFHFINQLHEQTSFVITTNKSPKQWVEVLGDEVLTTALLDRLLYRCEVIQHAGQSYRMKHRKSIFETLS
ncbi:DNA replication protein DnaC [Anseongella ginsenosidimutans]|uniref:DNA replication protein DnaC n=1 Tax=Anseongella ginsenosidimutans TaxID=496056 RepID=A0A4R3KJ26_9SPHI|nr:IS21-like element helper ATPase IstB [Anseongella ginsenosidimutans]QEC51499.1 ATP-binding protein [Anseongella ginsenosidimutans]QEC53598.1 ATP-binding protein [Anseongella ginsenosidimutans]TCS83644.1 DNA replication protein DnaC [Anseongella ginsenosidimutans]